MFSTLSKTLVQCLKTPNNALKLRVMSFHNTVPNWTSAETKSKETNEFKYSLNNNSKLTPEQRHFYEENGFLVIKNLVDKKEIDKYWKRFQDIANRKVKAPFGLTIQKEVKVAKEEQNENTVYKLQDLYVDDILFEYCQYPPVLDYIEAICGPNLLAIHTMLINKPPDVGTLSSRHPLHQDLHYFPYRPADRIACAWTAMETINRANGCLVAIPGTHKGEHLEHDYPEWEGGVNKMYYGVKDMSGWDKRVHVEMECGDTILFHPLLIHGSGANRTKGFRKAISCHYAASECHTIEVKGTLQEKLAQEVLDVARKKFQVEIDDYALIWRARSRLVRGEEPDLHQQQTLSNSKL